ncbi:MAG: ABC transporter permease [Planctomycetota bacterium]|nr:ABC transporter permease [Planctomycetota bacterium]
MRKILTIAVREFRSTALTKAFLFGAVVFPLLIWGGMLGVSAMDFKKPPLEGKLVVVDATNGSKLGPALVQYFDPEAQKQRAEQAKALIDQAAAQQAKALGKSPEQVKSEINFAMSAMGINLEPAKVVVELVPAETDVQSLKQRTRTGEVMAVVRIDERTMALDPTLFIPEQPVADEDADPSRDLRRELRDKGGPGTYEFIQGTQLRPDHAGALRQGVERVVKDERYRRAGVEPMTVSALSQLPVVARSTVVTDTGERSSSEGLTRMLPFIFLMLLYMSVMMGGNYLFYGTLEEKSSRVMEVILSAVSARQLLIGKMIGQGLVGLMVMAIYAGLGMAAASRFNLLQQVPMDLLPWLLVYFIIAYGLIGSLMLAVGSAVTEIREAQSLFTPITILIILPFMLMIPVMQNPGSLLARAASFFPPTLPYVMVMRLSQPSHVIPLWELLATVLVGVLGVIVTIWAAAKVFRVGVLMYGKPPSFGTLLKWIRHA